MYAAPAPAELHEAFLLNGRVQAGKIIGSIAAVGLFLGLVGGVATLHDKSIFDLAASPFKVYKPGFGYLIGPLLIAAAWPRVRRSHALQYAYVRLYRARIVIAALLWVTGMVVLVASVGGLSDAYTIKTGTYVAGALIAVGLIATLAMWPTGLRVVHATKGGDFQENVVAPIPGAAPSAAANAPAGGPPPNWYEDPLGEAKLRYWDGRSWTSYTTGDIPKES